MNDDPLDRFLAWFAKTSPIGFVPMLGPVTRIEDVTSILWFREKPFQVQMFIVPPNYVIPEHTHPNVDSYEIYLGGQIKFSHSGRWIVSDEEIATPLKNGLAPLRGKTIRVRPSDPHGGKFGPEGGVFMSVQRWLNNVDPHCVAADYSGVVMGPDHLAKVVHGKPVLKETLQVTDAATGELS